ncbi:uncharacterized protein LOC123396735 [Hordeum vulgare subsp. vulgare]|uniref:uncharacterized protein LOC123396735 n=1 Tax=Hordeum vulgare subsp. vulgare TaxID=112509 RepID=UPI001D1A3A4D|nr:uncharacterized protein LOC123396735 [Hordeum vulgare subsp. vulgare]
MDKNPDGSTYVPKEAKELGSQMKPNPQDSSDLHETTLSDSERTLIDSFDSERTLTNSFGEIQDMDLGGESEVESVLMLSQEKEERLVGTSATTHASSIRSIQERGLGDESEVFSREVVSLEKQVHSNDKYIGVRVITPVKFIPEHEQSATFFLKENSSKIQSGKKFKKRSREDNGGNKTQKSRNPNLQGNGTGESKRGRTNGQG